MTVESRPVVGVLALQGCVTPHRRHLEAAGAEFREVRTAEEIEPVHGLILPGGESTTMLKLIDRFELERPLRAAFDTRPVWGICAGAILMAAQVTRRSAEQMGLRPGMPIYAVIKSVALAQTSGAMDVVAI